jgi:hypothetical protein
MTQRPLAVTLVSCAFILSGTIGILYHAPELKDITTDVAIVWVLFVRLLAIVGGVYALRGMAWARWLLLAWIGYHVILSFGHELAQIITHVIVLAIVVAGLFNSSANRYFKRKEKAGVE